MNDVSITLPMAVPGKEYIIQSIKKALPLPIHSEVMVFSREQR